MTTDPTALSLRDALEQLASAPEPTLARMKTLYAPDLTFRDPLQTIHGWDDFEAMNRRLIARSRSLRFDVADTLRDGDHVVLTWTFEMVPRVGPALKWEGVSHLRLENERVVEHQEYFDLIGDSLKAVPLLGTAYRAVLGRLG